MEQLIEKILKAQNIDLPKETIINDQLKNKDLLDINALINMLRQQAPAETIAKLVDLPVEKIEEILRQFK